MNDIFGWFNYQEIFDEAVDKANDGDNFLEIGCFLGKSTEYLCRKIKNSNKKINLFVMDLFEAQSIECKHIDCVQVGDDLLPIFKENIKLYLDFVTILKGDSQILHTSIKEKFSFIFIDANHEYESVKKDLNNYYAKLNEGGIFAGHDYTENCGVPIAVNEFALQLNKDIRVVNSSWVLK
jgi:predicted O-methyltransferase YrrM